METECAQCGGEVERNFLLSGRCGYCFLRKVKKLGMETECAQCGDEVERNLLISGRCGYCVLKKVNKDFFAGFDFVLSEFHANLIGFFRWDCILVDFNLYQKEVIGSMHNTRFGVVFASRKNGTEMYKLYGLSNLGINPVRAYLGPVQK